ncbi:MAG: hypothetical protein HY453_01400 [Parcubacteria group bacterium]|nr:hypothetical protein [Parcubacteria group bacterium]
MDVKRKVIEICLRLALYIIVPLVIIVIPARFIDQYLGSSPFLFIISLVIALMVSMTLILLQMPKLAQSLNDEEKKSQ